MSLVDHLVVSRTPLELAKDIVAKAREIASLRDEVSKLKHELFWQTKSSARAEEIQFASRYRWARREENVNVLHCLIMQGNHGVELDHAIDLTRSTDRCRCVKCNGHGLVLATDNGEWTPEVIYCPQCDGTGTAGGSR